MRIHAGITTAVAALALSLLVGAGTAAPATGPSDSSPEPVHDRVRGPVRFELPSPTGRRPVGVTELHLVDRARTDPWVTGTHRELMVSVWYPARSAGESPRQPHMPPGTARAVEKS